MCKSIVFAPSELMSRQEPENLSLETQSEGQSRVSFAGGERQRIVLFGHFGAGNFGNESTLQALLYHLRRLIPNAEITCVCSKPETVARDYGVTAIPMIQVVVSWTPQNSLARLCRRLLFGIPSEVCRWLYTVSVLRKTDTFVIVGTGLLTDAFSLLGWGPYTTFKWSLIAKLCRCKLFFLSVGAGPLKRATGKLLIKSALSLAGYRSYRDRATLKCLTEIGFRSDQDAVYPDLAFSLPANLLAQEHVGTKGRLVVGIGLMEHAAMYGAEKTSSANYAAYLDTLAVLAEWVLDRGYDIRLLIGDLMDARVAREFQSLMRDRSVTREEERIVWEPIGSAKDLLSQLAATDFVVGTRFHNILLALLLNKPSIAISFHHKCSSLMSQMGLSEYCMDINGLKADDLIRKVCDMENNAGKLKALIKERAESCRASLDEQYQLLFKLL